MGEHLFERLARERGITAEDTLCWGNANAG